MMKLENNLEMESPFIPVHHFAKQFKHEPTPKPTQTIPEHDIVRHGDPAEQITEHEIIWRDHHMSVVKAFEILH